MSCRYPLLKLAPIHLVVALAVVAGPVHAQREADAPKRYIVVPKQGLSARVESVLPSLRGRLRARVFGEDALSVDLPTDQVEPLRRDPAVDYVEEDVKRYPMVITPAPAAQVAPYGIAMVQADQLADTYAYNRKVCIIDSGYSRGHEDLPGDADVTGEDGTPEGDWTRDDSHHGTHVAGTIAALDNAAGVVGVLPGGRIRLHIVKVFDGDGWWAYASTLASAANRCKAAGAHIISMSLGGGSPSTTEKSTFDKLYSGGVLSVAAAGNNGTSQVSYPAGYSSVVSVGAVDQAKKWATFSQYNTDVEFAAPGVFVRSTVPMGSEAGATLDVTGSTDAFAPAPIEGSVQGTVTAALVDFGDGTQVADATGKICVIRRGTNTFAEKVANCASGGGVGAVVFNNVAGGLLGSFIGSTSGIPAIPAVSASDTEGATLLGLAGAEATMNLGPASYSYYNGTSMATPHVSGVAALVWSHFPSACTAAKLRTSMARAAQDLGVRGRDTKYGYGLVQAKATYDRIKRYGCGR